MAGGRPLLFTDVKELQKRIDEYFAGCFEPKMHKRVKKENRNLKSYELLNEHYYFEPELDYKGEIVYEQIKPFTITGLAVALDTSRQTLLNYEERGEFFDTIKKSKDMCEEYAENQLFDGKNVAGPIFNLKNNYKEWEERVKQEHSGGIGGLLTEIRDNKEQAVKDDRTGITTESKE